MFNSDRLLIHNIGQLVTNSPLYTNQTWGSVLEQDLGCLSQAWVAFERGRIAMIGTGDRPSHLNTWPRWNAEGKLVVPGLVDCHTHLLFAGDRSDEFLRRLRGETYQDIAKTGGGILSTVRATRSASDKDLIDLLRLRLDLALQQGITTLEIKTGYGLTIPEELRQLRLIQTANKDVHQTLVSTCLALHGIPPEFRSARDYVDAVVKELLPQIARDHLAEYCDIFIEEGYFNVSDGDRYAQAAKSLGLGLRVHADEFTDAGAAAFAARWHAASADHLQMANPSSFSSLAEAGVVCTLLPGTSLYCKIPFTQAEPFRNAGCAVAIASDFNPGSCRFRHLATLAALAAIHNGLTLPEALAGITIVAAKSLGLQNRKGHLTPGADADLMILPYRSFAEWFADLAQQPPTQVWCGGCLLVSLGNDEVSPNSGFP